MTTLNTRYKNLLIKRRVIPLTSKEQSEFEEVRRAVTERNRQRRRKERIMRKDLAPATRPHRVRTRKDGRFVLQKGPDMKKNAKPKVRKVMATTSRGVLHPSARKFLKDPLDQRTTVGKHYTAYKTELSAHVGGSPTIVQTELIDQAAKLKVLSAMAWYELMTFGSVSIPKKGQMHPAFDGFLRVTRDQRTVLTTLGLRRAAKEILP